MGAVKRGTVAALIASALLAALASSSLGSRTLAIEGTVATITGVVTFNIRGLTRMTCSTTVSAGWSRTSIPKSTAGTAEGVFALIGEARFRECASGFLSSSAELLNTPVRPIRVRYESFLGTLPSITGFLASLLDTQFRIRIEGVSCEYGGDGGALFSELGRGQRFSRLALLPTPLAKTGGNVLCPASATFEAAALNMTPGFVVRLL